MTDRELLELAAKAAGVSLQWGGINGDTPRRKDNWEYWNPLTDDGDAFRLAVKLYLWEPLRLAHREVTNTVDIYAATRRAIVRAAAETLEALK